ncbi:hypothetical protein KR054_000875, partial [Drosophila jambulina]
NCTLPTIIEFPPYMRRKSWWAALVCAFFSIYIFVILAIVCDDYLLPAMERLCYAFKMSYDVAGATFLAASTSAPELFINVVGTFITYSDIGIGTIVGSSVFNVLVICAVCGILTHPSKMNWWPVTRDTFWYVVAIVALTIIMWDSYVFWYEAFVLLILYCIYFIQLVLDKKIKRIFVKPEDDEPAPPDPMSPERLKEFTTFREHVCGMPEKGTKFWMWIWWLYKYPAELFLAITIPNPRTVYLLTLLMSVVWISGISYLVTWFITVIGHNAGVPDSIMGLTFLAAGTSVPEVVSSYIVCKQGHGAMAICNAVGSNTVDILICLGLPWILQAILNKYIRFDSDSISITTGMLILTAMVMYFSLVACRFTLNRIVGWVCLISYLIFIAVACCLEMLIKKSVFCNIES